MTPEQIKRYRTSLVRAKSRAVVAMHNYAAGSATAAACGGMIDAYEDAIAMLDRAMKKATAKKTK